MERLLERGREWKWAARGVVCKERDCKE